MNREELLNIINSEIDKIGEIYMKSMRDIQEVKKSLKNTSISKKEQGEIIDKIIDNFRYSELLEESEILNNFNLRQLLRIHGNIERTIMETKKPYEEYINDYPKKMRELLNSEDIQNIVKDLSFFKFQKKYNLFKIENNINIDGIDGKFLSESKTFTKEIQYYLNLEMFDNINEIEELDLDRMELTQIPLWITEFKNLKRLNLSNNKITKIENLDNCIKLVFLYLSENKIQKIEGLNYLSYLERLELNNNKITEIKNLNELTSLENLNLSNNKITEFKTDRYSELLHTFNIKNNKITHIENIKHLDYNNLYLNGNPLKTINSNIKTKNQNVKIVIEDNEKENDKKIEFFKKNHIKKINNFENNINREISF